MTRVRIPLSNSLAALLVAALAACGGGGGGDAPPAPSATLDISAANHTLTLNGTLLLEFAQGPAPRCRRSA